MIDAELDPFGEVWFVDFEFSAPSGQRPKPVCLVARELRSGREVCLWQDQLQRMPSPPYPTDPSSLFVAYHAPAELSCHHALGWPIPARILDLSVEFRRLVSGKTVPHGRGLLGALEYHSLPGMAVTNKEEMRNLIVGGGPWNENQRRSILDYCRQDVDSLQRLLPAMLASIDLPRALLRGRFQAAVAQMEATGVPIDADSLQRLRVNWNSLRGRLVDAINRDFGIYQGTSFRLDRFEEYLHRKGIVWPRLESGTLCTDDETFREMARTYPVEIGPLRDLRTTLSKMKLNDLAVGPDGRNRTPLWPFTSKTGRNQPSNSEFIFGPACWLRSLIKPGPGRAICYVDWSQQELAIAAALSGDPGMKEAYRSGDFYLTFARMAGAVPAGATKVSHAAVREQFKVVSLGVLYGLSEFGIARKLNVSLAQGRYLLDMHKQTFKRFWVWSDGVETEAMLLNRLQTLFGWQVHVEGEANPRSLRNFVVQATGAEMMRIACCLLVENRITLCCPVHDAVLIEADIDAIDEKVSLSQALMQRASEVVLNGFGLRTDVKIVRYPDRYFDERGRTMWQRVMELLEETSPTHQ